MKQFLLGVDIGGTTIKIGKFDLSGDLIAKWEIPTDRSNYGNRILRDVYESISEHLDWDHVKGVGFGVPGPVAGDVVLACVNIGWSDMDVAAQFRALLGRLDIHVRASNDANVATTGEVFRGAAVGKKNVVMFTLGTGVGAGVVVDGRLVDGKNGCAGELGHLVVDFTRKLPCKCGKSGCLETVASATGIVNLAKLHLASSSAESMLSAFDDFSAKRVIDLAKIGDPVATAAVDEAADHLGRAVAAVLLTLNPELVVIGGGVSHAGPFFLDKISAKAQEYSRPFAKETPVVGATLGNDAGIYGAAYLVR